MEDNERTCSSYEFTPIVSLVSNNPIWAITPTKNWKWVFTGGSDGRIVKYDMIDTMLGKTMLTQLQRSGMAETVSKGGHVLNLWFNEDSIDTQTKWLCSRGIQHGDMLPTDSSKVTENDSNIAMNPAPSTNSITSTLSVPPDAKQVTTSSIMSSAVFNQVPPPHIPDISPVYSLVAHSEGQWVAAGTRRGGIALYTARHDEGTQFACLPVHVDVVSSLLLTHDELKILSGSWDASVALTDLNTGQPISHFRETISTVASITSHPTDINRFLVTSLKGGCSQWDLRSPPEKGPALIYKLPTKTPPWAQSACYNPNSCHVYIGRRNNSIDEYASNGELVRTLSLPKNSGQVSRMLCMPNGRTLLIGSTDIVRQWDLEHKGKGVPFSIIPGQGGNIADFAVDPLSRYMICTIGNRGWESTTKESALSLVFSVAKIYE